MQDLMVFLGLTNYFCRLICDYARIAQPLTDVTQNVDVNIPKFASGKARKGAYKQAVKHASLKGKWGEAQQKVFVTLKIILGSEPIQKPPPYDGRPCRITSEGSGVGLAGYLSQPFKEIDSAGIKHTRWHPISFTSKHTSPSEERYKLFLLEFTASKYCTDKFTPYIYGAPIEIETDCEALRDCPLKKKLSTHHSRWKELILAHNIINIRCRSGIKNPVANGLSCMWANKKRTGDDGSSWLVLPDWEA